MTTVTANPASRTSNPLKPIVEFARLFGRARRYEQLFAMSDTQLAARGLTRDGLVRSYITGLGHC